MPRPPAVTQSSSDRDLLNGEAHQRTQPSEIKKKIQEAFGPDVSRRPGYRQTLIEASIVTNAALAAYSLQQEFGSGDSAGLQVVYGVYLLETRQVWAPHVGGTKEIGLTAPPRDPTEFLELSNAILQSDRIASLIHS